MGEGVAEEALAAEDGEAAEDAADDAEEGAAEGDGAQGVVVLDVEDELAEGNEEGGDDGGGGYEEPDAAVGGVGFGHFFVVFSSQFLVFSELRTAVFSSQFLVFSELRTAAVTENASSSAEGQSEHPLIREGARRRPFLIHGWL